METEKAHDAEGEESLGKHHEPILGILGTNDCLKLNQDLCLRL